MDEKIHQCFDCPDGVQIFASEEDLLAHKWDMIRTQLSREHMNCHLCGLHHRTFEGLIRHYQLSHPAKQKLVCPGCRETFPRLYQLMSHIETGGCTGITAKELRERRLEKARAAAAVAERKSLEAGQGIFNVGEAISGGYGQYMGIDIPFPKTRVLGDTDEGKDKGKDKALPAAQPVSKPAVDGDSKVLDLLTDSPPRQRVRDVWSGQDMLGADESSRTPPAALHSTSGPVSGDSADSAEYAGSTGSAGPPPMPKLGPQDDLYQYRSPYSRRFNCPHMVCRRAGKTFKSVGAFRAHLQTEGVHTVQRVQCPMCSRNFRTIEALVQHCESQSVRCHLRDSEEYEQFLDTLTGGLVGIEGRHVDLTVSYAVPADAAKALAPGGSVAGEAKTDGDGWLDIWE